MSCYAIRQRDLATVAYMDGLVQSRDASSRRDVVQPAYSWSSPSSGVFHKAYHYTAFKAVLLKYQHQSADKFCHLNLHLYKQIYNFRARLTIPRANTC